VRQAFLRAKGIRVPGAENSSIRRQQATEYRLGFDRFVIAFQCRCVVELRVEQIRVIGWKIFLLDFECLSDVSRRLSITALFKPYRAEPGEWKARFATDRIAGDPVRLNFALIEGLGFTFPSRQRGLETRGFHQLPRC